MLKGYESQFAPVVARMAQDYCQLIRVDSLSTQSARMESTGLGTLGLYVGWLNDVDEDWDSSVD